MHKGGEDEIVGKISSYIYKIIKHRFPHIPPEMREDIHQEVQIKLWKIRKKGTNIQNIRSYMWRVVYTTALDVMDRCLEKTDTRIDAAGNVDPGNPAPIESPSLDHLIENREFNRELEQCLAALSYNKRITVKLYLSGMNIREIAEFLNWSQSKANHLYYRAIHDLKASFRKSRLKAGSAGKKNG